ncbi:MAG TPA: polyprenyl synthetase family protein [Jatrophihabitans sp.]
MTSSALGVNFDDDALERSVAAGMELVEDGLRAAVASDDPFVGEAARYLVEAGGKRFRPLMTLLAAHCGVPETANAANAINQDVIDAAVVCELTHLATLYHDDVMDEAEVRRGAPSANARWDNTLAILTGDFLFSRASNLVAGLGPDAVRLQATTFERLVLGQIHETAGPAVGVDPIEHYLSVLADKTGSLIATAAEFGVRFAGGDEATIAALRDFGEQYGLAFQISDDILDIASESDQSGKTPGTDLREGVPTLPVLYVLRGSDPADDRLRRLVSGPIKGEVDVAEALRLLRASSALDQARATLADYAGRARKAVSGIGNDRLAAAFDALLDHVVSRTG